MTLQLQNSNNRSHILSRWIQRFPNLKRLYRNSLYCRLGPFLCGLVFDNIYGKEYSIYFRILSLWTPQPGHILQSDPSSVVNIEGERAFKQCFIPYTDTSTNPTENYWMDIYDMLYGIFFKSEVEYYEFLNQLDYISALNRDIRISVTKYKILCQVDSLSEILGNPSHKFEEAFNRYAKRYSPALHYRLLRIRLAIALFYNRSKILEESLEVYKNESKYWSSNFLRLYPEFQIETIHHEFANRELFMTQIKRNCEKSTIDRLHCGQLTFR